MSEIVVAGGAASALVIAALVWSRTRAGRPPASPQKPVKPR